MASLSLYPQFETNLTSNRNVIELLLHLKSARVHGKNYMKSDLSWSAIFSVIVYRKYLNFSGQELINHWLVVMSYCRKCPSVPLAPPPSPLDDTWNPVVNACGWLKIHEIPQILCILTRIPQKPFKVLHILELPNILKSAVFGILQKLLLSFLEILKFFRCPIQGSPWGCEDIFWNDVIYYDLGLTSSD